MSTTADGLTSVPAPPSPGAGDGPSSSSLRVASEVALAAIVLILITLMCLISVRRIRYLMYLRRAAEEAAQRQQQQQGADRGEGDGGGGGASRPFVVVEGFVNLEPPRRQGLSPAVINSLGPVSEFKGMFPPVGPAAAAEGPPVPVKDTHRGSPPAAEAGGATVAQTTATVLGQGKGQGPDCTETEAGETPTDSQGDREDPGREQPADAADIEKDALPEQSKAGTLVEADAEAAKDGGATKLGAGTPEQRHAEEAAGVWGAERPGSRGAGVLSNECAVCLCEYRVGEHLRTLNKCGHHFHQDCIDAWLSNKATCPLCRTSLQPEKPLAQQPTPYSEPPLPPNPPPPAAVVGQEGIRLGGVTLQGQVGQQQQHQEPHQPAAPIFPTGLVIGSLAAPALAAPSTSSPSPSAPQPQRSGSLGVSQVLAPSSQWSLLRFPFMPFQGPSLPRPSPPPDPHPSWGRRGSPV